MKKKYLKILFSLAELHARCQSVDFTINSPGLYRLGDFLNSATVTNPDTIIVIQASNVVLDLAGYVVHQNSATAGVSSISINSGLSNVTIKNGVINSVTQDGIVINTSCSNIYLQDLTIQNCGRSGINASAVTNLVINNCIINTCATGAAGNNGIAITNGSTQCRILNTIVKNCGSNSASLIIGINLDVSEADLINVIVEECIGGSGGFTGLQLGGATQFGNFINCTVNNCSAAGYTGINVNGATAFSNIFDNCKCTSMTATAATTSFGFNVTTVNNIFKNCLVSEHGNPSTLFCFSVSNSGNEFIDCVAKNNTAQSAMNGFFCASSNGLLLRCLALDNNATAAGSTAAGFVGTAINFWQLQDCEFSRNVGVTNSFGTMMVTNNLNTLFSRAIGFNNGTVAANQLNGVPAASQAANTAVTINNFTAAWNNLALPT